MIHISAITKDASKGGDSLQSLDSKATHIANAEAHGPVLSSEDEFSKRYRETWGSLEGTLPPRTTILPQDKTSDEIVYACVDETSTTKESSLIPKATPPRTLDHDDEASVNQLREVGRNSRNTGYSPRKLLRRRSQSLRYDQRQIKNFKLPVRRTKWVSWTPGQRPYILSWERRFAVLDARHQNYNPRLKFSYSASNHFPEALKKALIEHESSATVRASWVMIPEAQRNRLWPELMCTVLDKYPNTALKVLSATYTAPYPPNYALSDCIDYIISHYLRNKEPPQPGDILKLYDVVIYMLQNGPPGHFRLGQTSIYSLVTNLEQAQVKTLYGVLDEVDHPLHQNTLMQFTYRLSNSGETDLAFKILKRIGYEGGDFKSPKMSSLCANLLERTGRVSSTSISDSQMFEFMLGCGMKPNLIIYNILLQNSFESGDHETGWQIYDMMMENGIKADEYTYSILLNDSKLRMDHSALRRVVDMIKGSGLKNAHIGTDVLHAIFLLHEQGNSSLPSDQRQRPQTSFERMLQVYCEYFDPQPLSQIIPYFRTRFGHLIPRHSSAPVSAMVPAPPTLVVMLTGLLKESTPQSIINHYHWFRHLVSTGNIAISGLMQSTHVYNLFIMAFGQSMETLDWCPRIVGDMVSSAKTVSAGRDATNNASSKRHVALPGQTVPNKGNESSLSDMGRSSSVASIKETLPNNAASEHSTHPGSSSSHDGPLPDVYTWSILLHIFISHRQGRAAEKVLAMMESRGVTPNQVTWNSLAVGYARLQNIGMTVDVISRLEKAGFQTDDITMKGMSMIQNRRALIEAMKAKEDANLKMNLGDRNKRRMEHILDKALVVDGHVHGIADGDTTVDDSRKAIRKDIRSRLPDVLYPPVRRPLMKVRESQSGRNEGVGESSVVP
jgi:pentatricopeptide repeat protein